MKNDERSVEEIKAAMDLWGEALCRKDVEAMHKDYADDYCLFDVQQTVLSVKGAKALWKACFEYFDKPKIEYKDMVIHTCGDMAIVHFKSRLTGGIEEVSEEMKNAWLRGTVGYRKIKDEWKCIHEHISFPVDCDTMKVDFSA